MTDDEIRKLAEAIGHEVYIANLQTFFSVMVAACMVMFVAIFVFESLRFLNGRK